MVTIRLNGYESNSLVAGQGMHKFVCIALGAL
mgnify:FL=1